MERGSRLILTLFLLVSAGMVCLHGHPFTGVNLLCVNDYLLTVKCSLSVSPSEDTYRVTFTEIYEPETSFGCTLSNTSEGYWCSVQTSHPSPDYFYSATFDDMDVFQVSLCRSRNNGSETCELLDDDYKPKKNIQPNAPCCLSVSHNSSQRHFTWRSTYEEHGEFMGLTDSLKYQLHYYERGDKLNNATSHEINTDGTDYYVDDENFVPDTEYAARVRSSPNQALYQGQWSDWSPEVHWRTESTELTPGLMFIRFCALVPLVLFLCCGLAKKWKQSTFIPTPAPYFHSLYSDCQGDFKSWVVTKDNPADMLQAEETVHIDTVSQCEEVQEESQPQVYHFKEDSTYTNMSDSGCDASVPGCPYTHMAPQSAPKNIVSLNLSSKPGSLSEGDSGCCLCSHTSLLRDPPFYCNEYCTLSSFQQSPVTAEHQGSPSTNPCIHLSGSEDVAQAQAVLYEQ